MKPEELSYSEAVAHIEVILHQIETGEMDIDELAAKVKQASDLLKLCKSKLFETEKAIESVLKEMEGEG